MWGVEPRQNGAVQLIIFALIVKILLTVGFIVLAMHLRSRPVENLSWVASETAERVAGGMRNGKRRVRDLAARPRQRADRRENRPGALLVVISTVGVVAVTVVAAAGAVWLLIS